MPISIFPHYMYMEPLSCHNNESTWATPIKNTIYVEANVMNVYAKFQLPPPLMASEERVFEYFFLKISLSVAMATNQNKRFGQNSYGW